MFRAFIGNQPYDPSLLPGAVGPLIDDVPLVTHAHIKPYIIAILLHRGAVAFNEVLAAVVPHCAQIDLKVGAYGEFPDCDPEMTRVEMIIEEVLGEMVSAQLVRYNENLDIWVLSIGQNNQNLTTIVNWVSALGGQLPHHLLLETGNEKINH